MDADKGQKCKSVFILNVVAGCIPTDLGTRSMSAIEEDLRRLHVAMTRAKDGLHLIVPQRIFSIQRDARHQIAPRMSQSPVSMPFDTVGSRFSPSYCTRPMPAAEAQQAARKLRPWARRRRRGESAAANAQNMPDQTLNQAQSAVAPAGDKR